MSDFDRTLDELLSGVRSNLDEDTAAFWTDIELVRWVNRGQEIAARHLMTLAAGSNLLAGNLSLSRVHGSQLVAQRVQRRQFPQPIHGRECVEQTGNELQFRRPLLAPYVGQLES